MLQDTRIVQGASIDELRTAAWFKCASEKADWPYACFRSAVASLAKALRDGCSKERAAL